MDGWTDCQMETQADRHDIRAQLLRTGGLEWELCRPAGRSEPSPAASLALPLPGSTPGPPPHAVTRRSMAGGGPAPGFIEQIREKGGPAGPHPGPGASSSCLCCPPVRAWATGARAPFSC